MKKAFALTISACLVAVLLYAQMQNNKQRKILLEARDEIIIKTGDASISMKKDGRIIIKGRSLQIEGDNSVTVKSAAEVILKGNKIKDN